MMRRALGARFASQLRAELRQLGLLTHVFLRRITDSELVSQQGELSVTFSHVLAFIALPGMLAPLLVMPKYSYLATLPDRIREPYTWDDKLFFVSLSMTLIGLLTLFHWDELLLDGRDFSILAALPIRLRTMLGAKIVMLLSFPAVFLVAISNVSSILYPVMAMPPGSGLGVYGLTIASHLCAVFAGGAFVFFAILAVQGVIATLCGYETVRLVVPLLQFALFLLMLSFFTLAPRMLAGIHPGDDRLGTAMGLFPPLWFLGLYETMIDGDTAPVFGILAGRALGALSAAVAAVCLIYLYAYLYQFRTIGEARRAEAGTRLRPPKVAVWFFESLLARTPFDRAIILFVGKTIRRSHIHRLILIGFISVGFLIAFEGLLALLAQPGGPRDGQRTPLLAMQLILTFFVLVGLRMVFAIPAELRANWVFQSAVTEEPRACQTGVRKAMFYCGACPILILLFPAYVVQWGWSEAVFHLGFGFACSCLLIDALLMGFTKIPFACAYLPGRARMTVRWPFYWLAFTAYGYGMASIEAWIMEGSAVRFVSAAAIMLAAIAALRILSVRSVRNHPLLYDEEPEPYLCTLELNRVE